MNETIITPAKEPDALAFIDNPDVDALQAALAEGQLQKLTTSQRLQFLAAICRSMGLNPLTSPFSFITLSGRMVIYANKSATDQLRKLHNVSIEIVSKEMVSDTLIVTARASMPNGRIDADIGAVPCSSKLQGEALAMAHMKAITKAKRRVTLSICGLGFMDESEIEDAQAAQHPQPGERATMPASAEVVVKDEQPPKPREPSPKEAPLVLEAETTPATAEPPLEDPEFELLTDFLTIIAEAKDADSLKANIQPANSLKNEVHIKTAKKAIASRADQLGLEWSAKEKAFVPKPEPVVA